MQYLGGKFRQAKRIAEVVNKGRKGRPILDPFCGGLSTAAAFGGEVHCSDTHPALISLYKAVQGGWDPPASLSEGEWGEAKLRPDSDPLKAFAGFGCSFGGKYFGGYARSFRPGDNYPGATRRRLLERVPTVASFECVSFFDIPIRDGVILYLDPPYRGTTGYNATKPLDFDAFDARVRDWARVVPVYVSEYDLPYGVEVGTFPPTKGKTLSRKVDRLYMVGDA